MSVMPHYNRPLILLLKKINYFIDKICDLLKSKN